MEHRQASFSWQRILGFSISACLLVLIINAARSLITFADLQLLIQRFPYLLIRNQAGWGIKGGFAMNILISIASMAISTVLGTLLGIARVAPQRPIRWLAWGLVQFFRNSPWLVVIYAMIYLLPYQAQLGVVRVEISPVAKSIIALSLVVAANLAEIVRGALESIPSGQWESSLAMGYLV